SVHVRKQSANDQRTKLQWFTRQSGGANLSMHSENKRNMHVPTTEAEKIPGHGRRKIKERKTSKERADLARAGACARAKSLKKAADIADLLADQDASGAIKVLRAGLAASKLMWDGNARDWVEQPDWRARHDCAMAILAYRFGKAIDRKLVVAGTFDSFEKLVDRLKFSPLAREELAGLPGVERVVSESD